MAFKIKFGNGGAANNTSLWSPAIAEALALNGPTLDNPTADGSVLPAGFANVSSVALPSATGTGGIVDYFYNSGLGAFTFDVRGAWNSVKNVLLTSADAGAFIIKDFVHAEVKLGGSDDSSVTIENAKRATVETGSGNDDVTISTLTNNAAWVNDFKVNSGDGADTIVFKAGSSANAGGGAGKWFAGTTAVNGGFGIADGSASKAFIDAGAGNDTIDLSGVKLKSATIVGGTGKDDMTGSAGKDLFKIEQGDLGKSSDTTDVIHNFQAGDKIDLYGSQYEWLYTNGNPDNALSVKYENGNTVLTHSNSGEMLVVKGVDLLTSPKTGDTFDWFV